jgi:hypothetical protein
MYLVGHFPFCRSVWFELVVFDVEFSDAVEVPDVLDVAEVSDCWEGCRVSFSPDDGALETWKGANRMGGKDILSKELLVIYLMLRKGGGGGDNSRLQVLI